MITQSDYDKIRVASTLSGCNTDVLEKDMWLTYLLQELSTFQNDNAKIVFCGGTSLAKAHCVMDRMSEDADFKIVLNQDCGSKPVLKKALKTTKQFIVDTIEGCGIPLAEPPLEFECGKFFSYKMQYPARYEQTTKSLKPFIQLECVQASLIDQPVNMPIYTISDRLLGTEEVRCTIPTVTLEETVAEKTVALLRRIGDGRGEVDSHS